MMPPNLSDLNSEHRVRHLKSLNILLANYRYFVSGGPERYLFNVKKLLEGKGHEVIPFSVNHPKNFPSGHSEFFLSPLSDKEEIVSFRQLKLDPKTLIKLIDRAFYSLEARKKLRGLLKKKDVDVAYILHFLRWISPSIFHEFSRKNIPIVVRISDFEYMCPGTHLLRNGEICETCVGKSLWPAVKHRCIQGSFVLSLAHWFAMSCYKKTGLLDKIDAFVCPSRFTLDKMAEAGFDRTKLFHIPTFVGSESIVPRFDPGRYILYFGRISSEKGINVLLEAFERYRRKSVAKVLPLYIIQTRGTETVQLREKIESDKMQDVRLLNGLSNEEFHSFIKKSAFTVVPSLFYENLPNVILESYAYGKAVIGSRRGSFLEVIREGETGLLFEAGDSGELADKMEWLADHPQECAAMGRNARKLAEDEYNQEQHYAKLMALFMKLLQS